MTATRRILPRWSLRYDTWPGPGLLLVHLPDPACPRCSGKGGHWYAYGGNQEDPDWDPCDCDDSWRLPLLPIRLVTAWRRWRGPAVPLDEPPF